MRATCAADAITRSTSAALPSGSAASPGQSTAMLPGASGHTCGAPGCTAARSVDHRRAAARNRPRPARRRPARPRASRPITMATASPIWRTRSAGERRPVRHDELGAATPGERRVLRDDCRLPSMSARGEHRDARPAPPAPASMSIDLMSAQACGERTKQACSWPASGASAAKRPVPRTSGSSSRRGWWDARLATVFESMTASDVGRGLGWEPAL